MQHRLRTAIVVVFAVAGISLSAWGIIQVTRPYDVPLDEGLERSTLLVDETTAAVAQNRELRDDLTNSDPERVGKLANNHSVNDHSVAGFDDCDSWRNLIHDGWNAHYGVAFSLAGKDDTSQLIEQTREFWVSNGHDVQTQTVGETFTRLWFETDFAVFRLDVDTRTASATIRGTTHCLSAG